MSGTSQGKAHVAGVCRPFMVGDVVGVTLGGEDHVGRVTGLREIGCVTFAEIEVGGRDDYIVSLRYVNPACEADPPHHPRGGLSDTCKHPNGRTYHSGDVIEFADDSDPPVTRTGTALFFEDFNGSLWSHVAGTDGRQYSVPGERFGPKADPPHHDRDEAERVRAMNAELLSQVNDLRAENRRLRDEIDRPRPFVVSDPDA